MLDADSVVANTTSRGQGAIRVPGCSPSETVNSNGRERLIARRYELGKRMQWKRSIVRLIIKKL